MDSIIIIIIIIIIPEIKTGASLAESTTRICILLAKLMSRDFTDTLVKAYRGSGGTSACPGRFAKEPQ